MNVVMMSLWRNDEHRCLADRVSHLLSKRSLGNHVRWLWVVGDSDDRTEELLRDAALKADVTVLRYDSGIHGQDAETWRRRGAWTATQMFSHVLKSDDIACLHESDLVSPVDVLDLLLCDPLPVAGWPTIDLCGAPQFYDTWAFRHISGRHFSADAIPPAQTFRVGSFGSCWAAQAALVRNRVLGPEAVVDLCRQWRSEGVELWVDPRILIQQPVQLWAPV